MFTSSSGSRRFATCDLGSQQGRIEGGGAIAPTKTYESNFIRHDF